MAERRYTLIFAAALATAGAATFGIYRVLEATKLQNKIVTRPVVVALQDVPEGGAIERTSVTVAQWPIGTAPAGAYSVADSVVGRVARVAVFKGEVIVPGRLAPDGTGPGLQVKISPGKRAAAVRIDDVAGLNGLIQPNSRVDILVTTHDANNQQISKLFMSNMRVLSIGTAVQTTADNRPISAPTAAIEVTPEEAEQLAIAQREGTIQLVLRGYGDPDSIKTNGAKTSDVLSQLRTGQSVKRDEVERRPSSTRRTTPAPQAPVQQAPVVAPPVVQPEAPKPKAPDSLTVQIFKGEKQDQKKFAKPDSAKKPDPAKPPAPAN
jgi:pilus assembly protein CpaB